jgi:hypothetical protein
MASYLPYRAVFYADLLGLVALLIVNAFYKENIPPASSLILAGIGDAGVVHSIRLSDLVHKANRRVVRAQSKRGERRVRAGWQDNRYAAVEERTKGFGAGARGGKVVTF